MALNWNIINNISQYMPVTSNDKIKALCDACNVPYEAIEEVGINDEIIETYLFDIAFKNTAKMSLINVLKWYENQYNLFIKCIDDTRRGNIKMCEYEENGLIKYYFKGNNIKYFHEQKVANTVEADCNQIHYRIFKYMATTRTVEINGQIEKIKSFKRYNGRH